MSREWAERKTAFAGAMVLLVGTAVALQAVRDACYPPSPVSERLLYVSTGDVVRRAALSYDAVLADIYWIRAIQHYGGDRRVADRPRRFELLYPLLDLTTSLDPRFTVAYRFGAIFLMEPYPGGAGRPDLAIQLLQKGIAQTPEKWEYYLDIGFVYYWRLSDYARAAEWLRRGGDLPGSPWWLRTYAAHMLTRGGDRESSRFLWHNIYATADNDWLRETAERRLLQLDALDQVDSLHAVVREFRRRTGRLPESWGELVRANLLRGEPSDPSGTPYALDAPSGAVTVAPNSALSPLPIEPTNASAAMPAPPPAPAVP